MIGTDYQALKRMCEKKTDLPILAIDTDGMELYDKGKKKRILHYLLHLQRKNMKYAKKKSVSLE